MKARLFVARTVLVVGFLLFAAAAGAAEINVMSSAGFKAAYLELLPSSNERRAIKS
jgi:hypothetical protein